MFLSEVVSLYAPPLHRLSLCTRHGSQHLATSRLARQVYSHTHFRRNLQQWAQFPLPGKLLSTLQSLVTASHPDHPVEPIATPTSLGVPPPMSVVLCPPLRPLLKSLLFLSLNPWCPHVSGRDKGSLEMCLPNGAVEAVAPLLLPPSGRPAGEGGLSPLPVARVAQGRPEPSEGSVAWAAASAPPQHTPSRKLGVGDTQREPQPPGVAAGCMRTSHRRQGRALSGRGRPISVLTFPLSHKQIL